MESFFIAVAKKMGLPGFGDKAIPDADDNWHLLNHPEDWFLRMNANTAFDKEPVPDVSDEELQLTGVERIWDKVTAVLKPEEQRKVGYVLARLRMDEHWQRLDAPDHIGVELACLSALWQTWAAAPAPEITGAIDFFTREHIWRWLPAYGDQLAQNAETSLYRLLGRLTRAFALDDDA